MLSLVVVFFDNRFFFFLTQASSIKLHWARLSCKDIEKVIINLKFKQMQDDNKNAFKALFNFFDAFLPVFCVNCLRPLLNPIAGLTFNNFQKIINKLGGECRTCFCISAKNFSLVLKSDNSDKVRKVSAFFWKLSEHFKRSKTRPLNHKLRWSTSTL